MTEHGTAVLRLQPDGEVHMNDQCAALMFGVDVSIIKRSVTDNDGRVAGSLPPLVVRNGIRRRKEYEAMTGTTDIDLSDALAYWARLDGVELVYEDDNGKRVVLVQGPGGDATRPH
ncbi:hypothetical protein [Gordonia sp. 'Campus']|uniref:hypothetical protein n=1 Tax=Gordonia sp. 'Campus' TaxID=2915824 RepID=UPI001EE3E14D|nr:hypothetical protein [Gordonia sp. 'Campus']